MLLKKLTKVSINKAYSDKSHFLFFILSLFLFYTMKRFISISLMFLMLGYAFIQIGNFMEYIVDIEAYTEKYCVNIEVPEKQCNGKCHLTEELAKTEEQHQQKEVQAPPEILLFNNVERIEILEVVTFGQENKNSFIYKTHWTEGKSNSIFQPPQITIV